MAIADYTAVVLAAGKGNRMPVLTENVKKPLLPVLNLPLYWFPLEMLRRNGVKECLLVVPDTEYSSICGTITDGTLPSLDGLAVEVVNEDELGAKEEDCELGTADVIRQLSAKKQFKADVLVVSGDLVTDLCLERMVKFHEEQKSMFTCLLTDSALGGMVPGPKERVKKYRDLVAFSPESSQLLYMVDEEDYGEAEDLPSSLFKSCPHVLLTAKYKDVHLYAFKRKALEVLAKQKSYSSLKADLIPNLLLSQCSKSKQRSLGLDDDEPSKCFAFFSEKNDFSLMAQCNNVGTYFEANKAFQKLLPKLRPELSPRKFEKATGVNCSESWVSQSASVREKCHIKRSIVGDKCEIGQNVRVDNSLLMSGVAVKDGANIKNSIVFPGVVIGEKAELVLCIVAPGQAISDKVKISNTTVAEERDMMAEE